MNKLQLYKQVFKEFKALEKFIQLEKIDQFTYNRTLLQEKAIEIVRQNKDLVFLNMLLDDNKEICDQMNDYFFLSAGAFKKDKIEVTEIMHQYHIELIYYIPKLRVLITNKNLQTQKTKDPYGYNWVACKVLYEKFMTTEHNTCEICFEDNITWPDEQQEVLLCGHIFHKNCINKWTEVIPYEITMKLWYSKEPEILQWKECNNNKCPKCREYIFC